jgi:hypothetical protein
MRQLDVRQRCVRWPHNAHDEEVLFVKRVSSSRRQIVMATLLGLAVIGAVMRYWAPRPSLARDIGTLLLVLWLPAIGNLIAFVVRQWAARRHRRTQFDAAQPFSPHLAVRLSPFDAQPPLTHALAPQETRCTVVLGTEGFTARTAVPLARLLAGLPAPQDVPLELLRPELALPRLAPGTRFHLMAGPVAVALGTVEAQNAALPDNAP